MDRTAKRALVVWTVVSAAAVAGAATVSSDSFEDGLGGWSLDSAAIGLPGPTAGVSLVGEPAREGRRGVVLNIEEGNASSAAWLERRFEVPAGEYDVELAFWVWTPERRDSNGPVVLGTIGPADPETRGDLSPLAGQQEVPGWSLRTLRKPITVGGESGVWAGFGLAANSASAQKLAFDDVSVRITPRRAGCAADLDGSGLVTVEDLAEFLSKWLSGSPIADFDASGVLDLADVFGFVNAWQKGCGSVG